MQGVGGRERDTIMRSSYSIQGRLVLFLVSAFLWTGCARVPLPTRSLHIGETGATGACARFFAALDQQAEQAGVVDPGAARVEKYPYLRVDRFITSLRDQVDDQEAFTAWVDRMQALDREARGFEIENLPPETVALLDPVNGRRGLDEKVAECGNILKADDFLNEENRQKLRQGVSVPDDYIPLRRVLGLYPLTSLIVSWRIDIWHAEAQKIFSPDPPEGWQAVRYFPPAAEDVSSAGQIVRRAGRDPLGIPRYSPRELETLFRTWAPVWEVQTLGDYDRIGEPIQTPDGNLMVETGRQPTFTLLSFTHFGGEVLTQLNYIIWFPSRPKESAWDIYGGFLDGLIYRVTLDNNGYPLLYETVHNCGCYYKAYPTDRLQVRGDIDYPEQPLILRAPESDPVENFMTVAMESRTHFVQHLYPSPRGSKAGGTMYSFADYNSLRSLPYAEDRRKSMFGRDALVPGSQRLERYILWPTGILSPGAMRQWGRHAVAFVGSRNFDDPFFMDRAFQLIGEK